MRISIALALSALAGLAAGCTSSTSTTLPLLGTGTRTLSYAARDRVEINEFSDLPYDGSSNYFPLGIVSGPNKLLWVIDDIDLDFGEGAVVSIATSGKQEQVYDYPGTSSGASFADITVGPDGQLWMTDDNNEQIVRLTAKGAYTQFPLRVDPIDIALGPDKALWFTAQTGTGNQVGRMTTTGRTKIYPVPQQVWDITPGPDGALWFTEPYANGIGRITTRGKITEYTKGITGGPYTIAAGPDGALWFTERATGGGWIGRITTAGTVTEYRRGIASMEEPNGIAAGPDGAMWFTEYQFPYAAAKIGRISMQGKVKEYSRGLYSESGPSDITAGPDGNMWFVETNSDRTGRITL